MIVINQRNWSQTFLLKHLVFTVALTLRLAPLVVFSMLMYFPSGQTSEMVSGPLAVLWKVVLAETSPLIIFMVWCDSKRLALYRIEIDVIWKNPIHYVFKPILNLKMHAMFIIYVDTLSFKSLYMYTFIRFIEIYD